MISFSVVVPAHNEEKFLPYSLPSVFGLCPDEVVFLLDRCTDNSLAVIKELVDRFGFNDRVYIVRLFDGNGCEFRSRIAYLRWLGRRLASFDVVVEVDADLMVDSSCRKLISCFGLLGYSCVSFLHKDVPVRFRNLLKRLYVRLGLPFSWLGSIMVYRKGDALALDDQEALKQLESAEDTYLLNRLKLVGSTKCFVSDTVHLRPKANGYLQGRLSWSVARRGWLLCLARGLSLLDFGFLRGYIHARLYSS